MRRFALAALALFAVAGPAGAQALKVSPEVHGTYAPAGDCTKLPRVLVDAGGIRVETATGRTGPLAHDVCYSCAGGAQYSGIQQWAYFKYGKDRWGGDYMPVVMMFNADEIAGRMQVELDNPQNTPLGAAMTEVARAKSFRRCQAGAAPARPAPAPSSQPPPKASAAPPPAAARSPADEFAGLLTSLMHPASEPANTFPDWRDLEAARPVRWAALPPESLDRPMEGRFYFRRAGTAQVGGRPVKILAGGARTMVFLLYFRNDGAPFGEEAVVAALRKQGLSVVKARCTINRSAPAPQWYRLSGGGKHQAMLWIAPARGGAQPWEGFNLNLEGQLDPMTPAERAVYTDRCT
ncbi:MAG: hypothetical protein ACK41C_18075 [Phenylobacterium sp.]|uniref:hypothetical protein n=1 Tax=Phenylobacterium sp. TaxID=1871053 RepID=UPI0039199895